MCDCLKCENYKEKDKSAFKKAYEEASKMSFGRSGWFPDAALFLWNAAIDAAVEVRLVGIRRSMGVDEVTEKIKELKEP